MERDIEFLQDIVRASPHVIYEYDQVNNRLQYATENLFDTFGYSFQQLQDMPGSLWAIVHPDDAPIMKEHVNKMMKGKNDSPISSTFRVRHAKGHYVWVNAVDRFFDRKEDGLVHRTIGFVSDVTSAVEAQLTLERANRANSFLLHSSQILSNIESDYQVVLQQLTEYVSLHFGAVVEVSTVNYVDSIVNPVAMYHPDALVRGSIRKAFTLHQVKIGEGIVGKVISEGVEILEQEASEELRRRIEAYDYGLVPQCYIYCPLRTVRGIIGSLNVTRLLGRSKFTNEDLIQIRKLAEHVALYIENAYLRASQRQELELRRKTQSDLYHQNNVNSFLLAVSRILSDISLGQHDTWVMLTQTVAVHFNVFCVVYIKDAESDRIRPQAFFHKDEQVRNALQAVFLSNDQENGMKAARYVTRSGKPLLMNGEAVSGIAELEMAPQLLPRAYGFWPLQGRESLGALCLCRPISEAPFTDDELHRATQLASHMTIFLENALLAERQRIEIENRKIAEQKLARREAEVRAMLNTIPINISRISLDFRYLFLNNAYTKFGLEPEKLVGRSIIEVIGQDAFDRALPRFAQVRAGHTVSYDDSIMLPNGSQIHFNSVIAPDIDDVGNVVGYYSCAVDVSQKIAAERDLRLSEDRYQSLLLNSGDAFCLHNFSGEILDVNAYASELLGYTREELLGLNINKIDLGWNTPQYPVLLAKVEPNVPVTIDAMVIHKNGTPIPVEVRFVKRIENDEILIQALVRDRTEKRKQELDLQKSEERLRVLIDNVDDIILSLDWDGTVLSINRPQQGYTMEDVVGNSIFQGMEDDVIRSLKENLLQAKKTGLPFEMLMRHHGLDGTFEWYLTHYCPVESGEMLVCVSRNITHLKESELQVMNGMTLGQEQERKRLGAELHDGVGQILSSIALELSQLRTGITLSADLLSRMDDLSQRVTAAIHEVRNISHDLMPGVLESFGLSEAIREVCQNMQDRTGIRFRFHPVDLVSQYPESIETHIYRITQELVTNSVRHAHCSSVHINLIDHGDLLSLSVEDDGVGFDTTKHTNGIGHRNIASRVSILRGNLSVESSRTSGTLVHIEIPKE